MTDKITEAVARAIDDEFAANRANCDLGSYQIATAAIAAYREAVGSEAVAYMHTMHMENGQNKRTVNFRKLDPYGQRGHDYDLTYTVTSEPLFAAPPATTPAAYTHRHVKRGTKYRILHEGKLQVNGYVSTHLDDAAVTIYQGSDGKVWVRPTGEFNDGRFELIETAPTPEATHEND